MLNSNNLLRDQTWIFSSTIKWIVLSIPTGVIVGSFVALFLNILERSINFISSFGTWHYLLIFPGLLFSLYFVLIFTRNEKVDVEKAIHEKFGSVSLRAIPVRIIATIVTIATGGSTGKEGPSAQIGAGITYGLAKLFKFDDYHQKRLVICGTAAGISAVFGTPITGAIFGVEILYAGQMFYDVLLPALIAGILSSMTAAYWGAGYLPTIMITIPELAPRMITLSIFAGIFFGVVSLLHIEGLHGLKYMFKKAKTPEWIKPLIGGTLLLLITFFFGDRYLGLGDETIFAAVNGGNIPLFAFALKSLAMSITFSSGGNGGVLTPTLFVGAAAGSFFAKIFFLDPSVFSALGLVAVLAGSTNTPIASTILAMELFGSAVAPFASIACVVSYIITGHRSLYPGQRMLRPKTRLFVYRKDEKGNEFIVSRLKGISTEKLMRFHWNAFKKRMSEIVKLKERE